MASLQREGGWKGHISEELQQQAKQRASPVVSQLLVSARKGFTEDVVRLLQEGGTSNAAIVDKVRLLNSETRLLHLHQLLSWFSDALAFFGVPYQQNICEPHPFCMKETLWWLIEWLCVCVWQSVHCGLRSVAANSTSHHSSFLCKGAWLARLPFWFLHERVEDRRWRDNSYCWRCRFRNLHEEMTTFF